MSKTTKTITILLSSPNDTSKERKIVSEIVRQINNSIVDWNVEVRLITWEENTYSTVGKSAQEIINEQFGSKYDIYLGIMKTRFGTPTKKAHSGTEEEFNLAVKRYLKNKHKVDIQFYFGDVKIYPSKIDNNQHEKVRKFKNKIQKNKVYSVLTKDYKTLKEFRELAHTAIFRRIIKLSARRLKNPKPKIIK